ncbi:MAG: GNAT family N-acetyltransferase [Candidatus Azobacteroides sp.]|nr:GNAT family N-acetyltransferase [Candidatus Azobacteroides sp.]
MDHLVIEKIRPSEINEVAAILTHAFIANPAYSLIFKKKEQLPEGLRWLFKTNLLMINHKQAFTHVVKEKDTGKIIGTFTLIPPEGIKNSICLYAKIGIPGFIFHFGADPLLRMLRLDAINKNVLEESVKSSGFHYLSMVVVKNEYQGTGVGSYMLTHFIRTLISSQPACKVIGLTTQLPENVTFYSRLGFILLDEGYIEYKDEKYYNYNMKLDVSCFSS